MIVLVAGDGRTLSLRRVRLRDRLAAWVRASALDHQLASGTSPEASAALALRARSLYRPSERRLLARGLRRIGALATTPGRAPRAAPICREAVRSAKAELDALAERLEGPAPVDVRGIATVRELLGDGAGPFYGHADPGRLRDELVRTLVALNPRT